MGEPRRLRVVLDTNVLLVSISPRSKHHWIFRGLLDGEYELVISNEILSEYEEIISRKLSPELAKSVVRTLLLLSNVQRVDPLYRWQLIIADQDDDKFVDCSVAANVNGLVTQDRHFDILQRIPFPKVHQLSVDDFKAMLSRERKLRQSRR